MPIIQGPWKRVCEVKVTPYDEVLSRNTWFERLADGTLVVFPAYPEQRGESFEAPVPMCEERSSYHDTLEKQKRAGIQIRAITIALDSRGMDGPEVDEALGVVEPTVDLWETGELVPTHEQVRRLATLTSYPIGFFYRKHPEHMGVTFMCGDDGGLMVNGEFHPFDPCPHCGGSGKNTDTVRKEYS